MQTQIILMTVLVALVALPFSTESTPVVTINGPVPPLCEAGIIDEMPLRIKKVCMALGNSLELSAALTQYIRSEAQALMVKADDLANPGMAGKRTDVDHVFLRFGRR